MVAHTVRVRDVATNEPRYRYQEYFCATYKEFGRKGFENGGCGYNGVAANSLLSWLVWKLREIYLGKDRCALLDKIRAALNERHQTKDVLTLQERVSQLDSEKARLVAAIRKTDDPDLFTELAGLNEEREAATEELATALKLNSPEALEIEALESFHRVANALHQITDSDPAKGAPRLAAIRREDRMPFWSCTGGKVQQVSSSEGCVTLKDASVRIEKRHGLTFSALDLALAVFPALF